jgi:signal transduction histidine kinase
MPHTQHYYVNFDLEVQDFGCGIPPDRLDNLFINFSKIEAID